MEEIFELGAAIQVIKYSVNEKHFPKGNVNGICFAHTKDGPFKFPILIFAYLSLDLC